MATVFIHPDNIYPDRDVSDLKVDGDHRTIQELTGATPMLTVEFGGNTADC